MPYSITYRSRDLPLRLFCLEYPVPLPTVAEIYIYASSVWRNLFDYLLEQRFISTILPIGLPCSITYWSRDLSLRLFRLEYPVRLLTGAEIYLYASSVWSTLFDYLLEQRFFSTPLRLEYPIRLPTGAEIYLYVCSSRLPYSITYWSRDFSLRLFVWSALFIYLQEQRFISTPLPSGIPCSITYWNRDFSVRLYRLEYIYPQV